MPPIRVGISGWTYPPWRGIFYPHGLPHRLELHYASRLFNSVEINGSFYRLQRPVNFQQWYTQTPADFCFAIKGGRFITHMKKLHDVQTPLANFFASGVLCLEEKLGPILWQFGSNLGFDLQRFEPFFRMLPTSTTQAAHLARHHDEKLKGGGWTHTRQDRPLRYAVEIRKDNFLTPAFIGLLRRYNIALVFADTAGIWPYTEDLTADFVYLRLHGAQQLYAGGYTDVQLDWWASRIAHWQQGREPSDARRVAPPALPRQSRQVYVYFDNDANARAPFDALNLARRLADDSR